MKESINKTNETKLKNLSLIGALISALLTSTCSVCPLILTTLLGITAIPSFMNLGNLQPYFLILTYLLIILTFYFYYKEKQKLCSLNCEVKTIKKKNLLIWISLIFIFFLITFPIGAGVLILFPTCAVCPVPVAFLGVSGLLFYLKYFSSYQYGLILILIVVIFYFLYKKKDICKRCKGGNR
jgi:hypothetical protein